ncbi:hypothetical protein [Alysiella filiformis]|nr:hypothetical protein [Alysiella filiformis]
MILAFSRAVSTFQAAQKHIFRSVGNVALRRHTHALSARHPQQAA